MSGTEAIWVPAAIGAVGGAVSNQDDPLKGALMGGTLGAAGGYFMAPASGVATAAPEAMASGTASAFGPSAAGGSMTGVSGLMPSFTSNMAGGSGGFMTLPSSEVASVGGAGIGLEGAAGPTVAGGSPGLLSHINPQKAMEMGGKMILNGQQRPQQQGAAAPAPRPMQAGGESFSQGSPFANQSQPQINAGGLQGLMNRRNPMNPFDPYNFGG